MTINMVIVIWVRRLFWARRQIKNTHFI